MATAVKLDEDLSALVGEPLERAGYEVRTVAGQGWSGLADNELWSRLLNERAYFITADKGFGDIRAYPPGTHAGILLLRPNRESVVEYRELVEAALARGPLENLASTLAVASPRGLRIRRG